MVKYLKPHKAAGPDEIVPDLLKRLTPSVQLQLLTIMSQSWQIEWCSECRLVATILGNHKNPVDVGRYRRIAQT